MITRLIQTWQIIGRQLLRMPNGGACYTLAQSSIPVILPSSGTVATNGTITLLTALPTTYTQAWVYLPAGAISGGAAGLYYCVFSSTTVGAVKTLYADPASAFTPYIPTVALVAATGSNSAYTTLISSDTTLLNLTVPAATLGTHGALRIQFDVASLTSINVKTYKWKYGGSTWWSSALTTLSSISILACLKNRGTGSQLTPKSGQSSTDSQAISGNGYITVDSTAAQTLLFTAQLALATEYVVLESTTAEVVPA